MKVVQSLWFWMALVLLIVVCVGVALKHGRRREPGFKDFVKDPALWDQLAEDIDRAAEVAKTWNDEEVATAVRRFVFETKKDDGWGAARVFRSLGPRTHAILLQILRDQSLRAKLLKPTSTKLLPEAPLNRLCDLLDDDPPEEAVALLIPFLDEPSAEIRKSAAIVIGSVGSESIIPPTRKALADSDEYVRSYALIGLERARSGNRLSDVCSRELFGDLKRLLLEGNNSKEAAELLLEFNQEQAKEFFLSEAMLSPASRSLHDVLRALNAKGLPVPRNKLLNFIDRLDSKQLEYPQTYQLGEVLLSLGKHRLPEDRAIFEKYLHHPEAVVAEGAAAGLLASHNLDGFRERIWETVKQRGVDALTVPQRQYQAVVMFDGEVRNGGLSQYFFNSSGDEWKAALSGLEAMESKERLTILREALANFGPNGPSVNRDKRMVQLSKLAKANDEVFDALDSRYYKCKEVIDVLASRYVLKNPEAFR